MLNRLRPMALGHVPLREILSELVQERARTHPDIAFSFSADKLMRGYGDSIDLTVYRCVQESLTNVIKHARATRVGVELGEAVAESPGEAGASQLALTVRDDGRGIDPATPPGFGISGMQERVQALGGSYKVDSGRRPRHLRADRGSAPGTTTESHDQRSDHRRPPDRAAGLPAHAGGRRRRDRAGSARRRRRAIGSIAAIIPTW